MITKRKLIEEMKEFASEISPQPLCKALHLPESEARPVCCFQNVLAKVEKDGGRILFGWTLHHRVNLHHGDYLMATHHAVWLAPDNKLVDVTPFTESPQHHPFTIGGLVLFVVDELAEPVDTGTLVAPLPLKFFPLSDGQELKDYVAKITKKELKACQDIYSGKVDPAQIAGVFRKPH
ncbi:hypothetical protein [Geminocystis sp. NIES-3709]|uniref:hypothetical protein n=1 Tax=Geminocystis sp. NIES-3709 TaxID=1617448 RepID=UPI0005FC4030|nr:hypothetical protein [Geminocystis sp. NIES-3709]BAQ66590.1 hypothetical protein GM3709_3355 [Geminocystis sp. NIES-3709]